MKRIADLAPDAIPQLREYEYRQVIDALEGRIRLEKVPVAPRSTGPYYAPERGRDCWACDRGAIRVVREYEAAGQVRETTTIVRCFCKAGEALGQSIATYQQVFGCWPARVGARVDKPAPAVVPFERPEPRPQPRPQEPAPTQDPPPAAVREVDDWSDFE